LNKPQPERRRPKVEAGDLLILHPEAPAGGYPMVVPVDHVADGVHWFLGSCAPVERGETLMVESPIQNDARYSTSATVVASTPETFALRLSPNWERVQQRAFVRISAHGLQVRVVRLTHDDGSPRPLVSLEQGPVDFRAGDPDRESIHELLDLSAGGIRFEANTDYEADEEVVVHFELPGSQCFALPARVVRTPGEPSKRSGKRNVAVAFTGIDEPTRSQLLRWVYRQQIRRHRAESR
jgi:c-di-GMP-binding flagellar brake protein YcgR